MNRILKVLTCCAALCAAGVMASAQVKEIRHDFSAFNAVEVDYDFNVNVVTSDKDYSILLTVDDVLTDYVKTYVKGRTLYISFDKKSLPKDIKNLYKGRKSDKPTLMATVYAPKDITSFKLSAKAVLSVENEIECEDFKLELDELSSVKKISVNADKAVIKSNNTASANMIIYADELEIEADGKSSLDMDASVENLNLKAAGACSILYTGETVNANLDLSGSSKATMKGNALYLGVTGSNSSSLDAINLKTPEASVKLSNSSKVTEAATEKLHIEMSGNSTLVFDNDPAVDIISIKSSTVTRYEPSKK